jgi:hypothetical protein
MFIIELIDIFIQRGEIEILISIYTLGIKLYNEYINRNDKLRYLSNKYDLQYSDTFPLFVSKYDNLDCNLPINDGIYSAIDKNAYNLLLKVLGGKVFNVHKPIKLYLTTINNKNSKILSLLLSRSSKGCYIASVESINIFTIALHTNNIEIIKLITEYIIKPKFSIFTISELDKLYKSIDNIDNSDIKYYIKYTLNI